MARTYTCLYYQVIFSTKNREPWFRPDVEQRVWSYLGGIARENEATALQIGGIEDHVHCLVALPPVLSVSKAVQFVKGGSSGWVKKSFGFNSFAWQDGYGAFTVSKSQIPEVVRYIQNQREHHRNKTFKEEYLEFLNKHGITYDERYLWD